jgi:hypothetical protein
MIALKSRQRIILWNIFRQYEYGLYHSIRLSFAIFFKTLPITAHWQTLDSWNLFQAHRNTTMRQNITFDDSFHGTPKVRQSLCFR